MIFTAPAVMCLVRTATRTTSSSDCELKMPTSEPPPDPPRGEEDDLPKEVVDAIRGWSYHDDVEWWFDKKAAELIASLVEQGVVVLPKHEGHGIDIKDIQVNTIHAGINTPWSVTLIHLPTGTTSTSQDQSFFRARDAALDQLGKTLNIDTALRRRWRDS